MTTAAAAAAATAELGATNRKQKMKTSFARGLFFLGGALLMKNVVAKPRSYWDGARGIVKACDDFDGEGDVVASGTVTFLRPLQCKTPLVRDRPHRTAQGGK